MFHSFCNILKMDACVNKEIINFVLFIFSQMYQHVLKYSVSLTLCVGERLFDNYRWRPSSACIYWILASTLKVLLSSRAQILSGGPRSVPSILANLRKATITNIHI